MISGFIETLVESGHYLCTYNWTGEVLNSKKPLAELSRSERIAIARTDYTAVRRSDLVWIVLPKENSIGASAEMGAAIILGIPVIISGPHDRSAMTAPARWLFSNHEEALYFLIGHVAHMSLRSLEMSDAKEVERRLTYRIDGLEERIATLEKQISELTNKKETGAHAHEKKLERIVCTKDKEFCVCPKCILSIERIIKLSPCTKDSGFCVCLKCIR